MNQFCYSSTLAKERPLNVALVSVHGGPLVQPGSESAGGQNVYVREVARELAELGHQITVFTRGLHHAKPEVIDSGKVKVVRLPAGPPGYINRDQLFDQLPEFLEHLSRFDGFDILHSNYWLSGWVGMQYSKSFGVPQIHTHHSLGAVKYAVSSPPHKIKALRCQVEAEIMQSCAAVIATSAQEVQSIQNFYHAGLPAELVPCGVDTSRFFPRNWQDCRQTLGLSVTTPVLLYVGRFHPQKGIDTFLEAAALISRGTKVQVVLVGGCHKKRKDAQNFQEVQSRVERLELTDCTTFLGNLDHDQLPLAYCAADVCVVPSHYESFGMVAIESMACGTPVVASKVGGLRYTIRDRETGLLVPAKCSQSFAEAIQYVIDNPGLGRQFGIQGLQNVQKHYTWPTVAKSLARVYSGIASRTALNVR